MSELQLSKTELKHAVRDLVEEGRILVKSIGVLVQRAAGKAGMMVHTDKDKVGILVNKIWCRPLQHYYSSRGVEDGRAALTKLVTHHIGQWCRHKKALTARDPYQQFELLVYPEPWHDKQRLTVQFNSRMKTLRAEFDFKGGFMLRASRTSNPKDIMRDLKLVRAMEKRFNPKAPRHRRIYFHEFTVLFTPKLNSGSVSANSDPKRKMFRDKQLGILKTAISLDGCVSSIMAGVPVEEL